MVQLKTALDRGEISMDTVDATVSRVLLEKFRTGLFDKPYADEGKVVLQSTGTVSLARQVATEAITILDNVYAEPHTGIDEERRWFGAYLDGFADEQAAREQAS